MCKHFDYSFTKPKGYQIPSEIVRNSWLTQIFPYSLCHWIFLYFCAHKEQHKNAKKFPTFTHTRTNIDRISLAVVFPPPGKFNCFSPFCCCCFFLGDAASLVFVLGKFTLDLDWKNKQGTARGQVGVNVGFFYLKKIFFSGFRICWTRFGRKFFGQALVDFIHSHPHTHRRPRTHSQMWERERYGWMNREDPKDIRR